MHSGNVKSADGIKVPPPRLGCGCISLLCFLFFLFLFFCECHASSIEVKLAQAGLDCVSNSQLVMNSKTSGGLRGLLVTEQTEGSWWAIKANAMQVFPKRWFQKSFFYDLLACNGETGTLAAVTAPPAGLRRLPCPPLTASSLVYLPPPPPL